MHHPDGEKPVEVDYAQMATAQKLLLFWRKPAVWAFILMVVLEFHVSFALLAEMLVGWYRCGVAGRRRWSSQNSKVVGTPCMDFGVELGRFHVIRCLVISNFG